jgi:hypothetical protein
MHKAEKLNAACHCAGGADGGVICANTGVDASAFPLA